MSQVVELAAQPKVRKALSMFECYTGVNIAHMFCFVKVGGGLTGQSWTLLHSI